MKKTVLWGFLLSAGLLVPPASAADSHVISMSGHGEAKGVPDMAMINAGVTTNAATAAAALSANTARMAAVFAALRKLGVADRDMQTVNFSVSPQYANDNGQAPRLTGYQVHNEISVRLADAAKLGAALDALVAAGANQMNGVSFDIAQPAALLEKARQDAMADARTRAETYAKAAGVSLGPILSIREGTGEARPLRMAAPIAFAAKAVPVAAGEQAVTADVQVEWEIH